LSITGQTHEKLTAICCHNLIINGKKYKFKCLLLAEEKDKGCAKISEVIIKTAISGFSGQKSGTKIILSILQSSLHFLKS